MCLFLHKSFHGPEFWCPSEDWYPQPQSEASVVRVRDGCLGTHGEGALSRCSLAHHFRASLILMGNTLFSSVPGMLMVLFWGPLSDKWGRKPVLLIAYVGAIAQTIIDFLAIVYSKIIGSCVID